LEDLVIYNPATRRQQDEMGLLLVTQRCDQVIGDFIDLCLSRGHSIARLPNLSIAACLIVPSLTTLRNCKGKWSLREKGLRLC
jgi:hypothetical protein